MLRCHAFAGQTHNQPSTIVGPRVKINIDWRRMSQLAEGFEIMAGSLIIGKCPEYAVKFPPRG